jgi:hypothetical protein
LGKDGVVVLMPPSDGTQLSWDVSNPLPGVVGAVTKAFSAALEVELPEPVELVPGQREQSCKLEST